MHTTVATSLSTASANSVRAVPRIGVLGIMQELYDEMLPGITERQGAYAAELGAALGDAVEVLVAGPARDREGIERGVAELEAAGVDGVLVVMLTYGPGMRVARALGVDAAAGVPRQRPARRRGDARLGHGRPDVQPGDPRGAGHRQRDGARRPPVPRDHRRLARPEFRESVAQWARAAAAVTRWRRLKVAVFGYAMNGMGDIRVDVHSLLRTLGPQVDALAPGALHRAAAAAGGDEVAALIADEDARFEVDPRLTAAEREDHARMQLGLERILTEQGYGAYSTHFGAIADDGRFARLPLAAASSLMAKGFGYAAEGDALTAALMAAARTMLGDTQFTEMYAMDFPRDAILMSHMGEGNWVLARDDRPVRLIKRPLGIGGLGGSADVRVPVRPRAGDARHARRAGGRALPARRLRGRGDRRRGAAGARDAVRVLPPRRGRARLHGCLAAARRAAPPGAQLRPPRRRLAALLRRGGDRARAGRRRERLAHGEHEVDPGRRRRRPASTLKFSDAQQKQENQIKAIRSYIQQKVDVIAFSPVVESGWDTVLNEAKRAKIPVILTDRAVDSKDTTLYKTFLGSDFVKEGKKAGEWLARGVQGRRPGPVNIVELQGTTGSAPAIDRKAGLRRRASRPTRSSRSSRRRPASSRAPRARRSWRPS